MTNVTGRAKHPEQPGAGPNEVARPVRQTAQGGRFAPLRVWLLSSLLTACGGPSPVVIGSFSATPAAARVGEAVVLRWRGTGAASCTLTTGQRQMTPPRCDEGSVVERYPEAGTFVAELSYTAPDGLVRSRPATVTVAPAALGFTSTSAPDGLSVGFEATGAPADARLSWSFGDGGAGAGRRVVHRYAEPGSYRVELVAAQAGGTTRAGRQVTVTDAAPGRVALFSGDGLGAWRLKRGGAPNWRTEADYAEVTPGRRVGYNDLRTREAFGDFRLHVEFMVPPSPAGTPEQARGNSGVFLQGRYEVQVLDSYRRALSGENDAGAVYEVANAAPNASRPAGRWQSYDITFRAARFSGGRKLENARVSVVWNGVRVHDELELPGPTRLGDPETGGEGALTGPVVLQDHGDRVRYRNLWLEPLGAPGP